MRAVIQRSAWSRVCVAGKQQSETGPGLVVLLGIKKGDQINDGKYLMNKIINLRIFEDENGKMNRSLADVNGEMMLISQFTLYADARKGRRPSFTDAEDPEEALSLFNQCVRYVAEQGVKVATGVFGADMQVSLINQGPCTILLDSERQF